MKSRLYLLSFVCLLAACQTELPLPDASGTHRITLLGELVADDSIQLRAGQSIPFGSGATPELLRDLEVSVNDGSINTALQEREDYLSYSLFTLAFTSLDIVTAGGNYTVAARHAELGEVTATVAVPKAFSAALTGKAFTTYNNDSVLRLDIDVSDANAANAQYVVEAMKQLISVDGYFIYDFLSYRIKDNQGLYDSLRASGMPLSEYYDTSFSDDHIRQQFYINDGQADNDGPAGSSLFSRLYLTGKSFGGMTHRTHILIPRNAVYGEPGQYAKTIIYVKSVAADYYKYLKAYDAYNPDAGPGGNNIPERLPGNIHGGYGMLGGVYRRQFELMY